LCGLMRSDFTDVGTDSYLTEFREYLKRHLTLDDGYEVLSNILFLHTYVKMTFEDTNILIRIEPCHYDGGHEDFDVILMENDPVGYGPCHNFNEKMHLSAIHFRRKYPEIPIILVGYREHIKITPEALKDILLKDHEPAYLKQSYGDKLANRIGAIKCVWCNGRSGRGFRILLDEIAIAGLERLRKKPEKNWKMLEFKPENCTIS